MGIFLTILACISGILFSEYQYVGSIEVNGDLHRSDPSGNIIVVKENRLVKFDANQHKSADYSNPHLGNIFSVDVSDQLKILLYFKDHNQIVWLDNHLNEIRSPLFLDELGIDQAELICASSQGGFWVFNGLNTQIQYFNAQLQLVHKSMSLTQLTGPGIKPSFMIEKNQQLFLNLPGTGILIFDRFGNYSKTLALDIPSAFQVTDNNLYYFKETKLNIYDLQLGENITVDLPITDDLIHAEMQPGYLYLYTKIAFQIYKTSH
jgi:hypothetical protein